MSGYSLAAPTDPSFFETVGVAKLMDGHVVADPTLVNLRRQCANAPTSSFTSHNHWREGAPQSVETSTSTSWAL